ncbi:MAG TPA: hypothetical protein VMU15_18375 [Anaeromyxobacter sp.]|nr:hypothetical protein [Anaeromyxobacter sp.]
MSVTIHRAEVKRSGDVGLDLPAGASAGALQPTDYRPVDMEPEERMRIGVIGVDLPAGASARDLKPEDYQPFVVEPANA